MEIFALAAQCQAQIIEGTMALGTALETVAEALKPLGDDASTRLAMASDLIRI